MILSSIGSIAYWSELTHREKLTIHLNHTFQKQSELSQYDIVTAQGRLKLSIPTQKSTRKGPYKNVLIDYNSAWQVEHWRSIENSYRKSPFYLYYGYKVEDVYMSKHHTLVDFNKALFDVICKCLKMNTEVNINNIDAIYYTNTTAMKNPAYPQVFDTTIAFQENVSVLDLLFNLGPEAKDYLASL